MVLHFIQITIHEKQIYCFKHFKQIPKSNTYRSDLKLNLSVSMNLATVLNNVVKATLHPQLQSLRENVFEISEKYSLNRFISHASAAKVFRVASSSINIYLFVHFYIEICFIFTWKNPCVDKVVSFFKFLELGAEHSANL